MAARVVPAGVGAYADIVEAIGNTPLVELRAFSPRAGVRVARTLIAVYAIAGMLAALAGVIQDARIGAASPQVGGTVIFNAAAAVLLGGTSFAGGIGGVGGTAIGVAFLATLQQGLSVTGVQDYWQQIITGVILIVVVLLDRVQHGGLAAIGLGRLRRVEVRTGPPGPTDAERSEAQP